MRVLVVLELALFFAGCGESRRSIGEECLRDDDCLSSVCAARTCAAAPFLVTGAASAPPNEGPRLPGDAGQSVGDAPLDASPEAS